MTSIALDRRLFGLGVMFDIVWKKPNNGTGLRKMEAFREGAKLNWLQSHVKNFSGQAKIDTIFSSVDMDEDTIISSRHFDSPLDIISNVKFHKVKGDFGILCREAEHNENIGWDSFPGVIEGSSIFARNLFGIKDFSGKVPRMSGGGKTVNLSFALPALESFRGLENWIYGLDCFALEIECSNNGLDIDSVTGFLDSLLKNYKGKCKRLVLVLNPVFEKRMQDYIERRNLLNGVSSDIDWVDILYES